MALSLEVSRVTSLNELVLSRTFTFFGLTFSFLDLIFSFFCDFLEFLLFYDIFDFWDLLVSEYRELNDYFCVFYDFREFMDRFKFREKFYLNFVSCDLVLAPETEDFSLLARTIFVLFYQFD